jgi:hypothetical protein
MVVLRSLITPSLVLGIFLEALGIATQMLQPFLMKEVLKVLAKKGMYEAVKEMMPDDPDFMLEQMGIENPTFPYGWIISIILCPFLVFFFFFFFFI